MFGNESAHCDIPMLQTAPVALQYSQYDCLLLVVNRKRAPIVDDIIRNNIPLLLLSSLPSLSPLFVICSAEYHYAVEPPLFTMSVLCVLPLYNVSLCTADVVTCMSLDRVGTGDHLITGSRDTTCVVWRFGSNVSITFYHRITLAAYIGHTLPPPLHT